MSPGRTRAWPRSSWRPPAGVDLGTFLLPGPTGWTRWLRATDPLRLPTAVALEAGSGALHDPAALRTLLPRALRGVSFRDLALDDVTLLGVTRALPRLVWLDLRGTHVTADGVREACSPRGLRGWRLRHLAVDAALAEQVRDALPARVTVHADEDPTPTAGPRPPTSSDREALLRLVRRSSPQPLLVAGALARAGTLIDVDRPLDALGLLAPGLGTGDPDLCILAARCATHLGEPLAALAALDLAPPSPDVGVWRAIVLAGIDPVASLEATDLVLAERPDSYLARWSRCRAFIALRQYDAAEPELVRLRALRPADTDTLRSEARLATARREHRRAAVAWQALLTERPDDPAALAGLARAQRASRSLSPAWMRSLAGAAASDMDLYGTSLLSQVTGHRRAWARTVGLTAFVAAVLLAALTGALDGVPAGVVFLVPLVAASLAAFVIWHRTPTDVRRTIRRTDELSGTHRAPDWRRGVGASVVVVAGLLLSLGDGGDPAPCTAGSSGCAQPLPTVPPSLSPIQLPTPVTPSIHIDVPTMPPVPQIPTLTPRRAAPRR